jgi:NTP pyrophosphatase (non-canonical NTP hydrolase)
MRIGELVHEAHALSREKGWYDTASGQDIPTKIALIHSEVSEALEEFREISSGRPLSEIYFGEGGKPLGFASELADVVIRVCDLAGFLGIDLEEAIRVKHEFNKTRAYRHGGKVI